MDSSTRSGLPLSSQLNWLMALAVLVPVAAIFGLGAWAIRSSGSSGGLPSQTLVWGVTFGLALAAVVFVAGAWYRMRTLVRTQTLELAEICRQVAAGDRSLRAPVNGEDEFAVLASAVNAALDGVPHGSSATASSAADSQDAATLQAQIEKLLQEVSAVGDGDLRVQAEVTPDTLGVLADSFNYMIEELAKVVGRVQATTFQVTNATRRLLDRSAEVAQASDAQSQQISQTTEAVGRLADFVQLSANNALSAAEAARDALRNAENGQESVVQTINGMNRIRGNVQETSKKIKRLGERSKEVGEIVGLIEEIADQTNLLALNAAIQSAMAGEHGRGFAVVADEIRLLAERVTEATKKITAIVKSIQGDTYEAVVAMDESTQEVVRGSEVADQAGDALRSIYTAVDRQAQMMEGIARAANERAQTSEAVAGAMTRIAAITRQTNTATQDTTAAVSYLAELAEQLRASVATFRLPEQAAQRPAALMPPDNNGYPPFLNLPNLGTPAWGDDMPQLPALPAGPVNSMAAPMMPGSYDYNNAYEGFYPGQQPDHRNGVPVPRQGYGEQPPGQGPTGYPPFPSDLY